MSRSMPGSTDAESSVGIPNALDQILCNTCYDELPANVHNCAVCDKALCEKCGVENDCISLDGDWLYDLPNKCEKCARIICSDCLRVCFDCANEGDGVFMCKLCADGLISDANCRLHIWYRCRKHNKRNKKCAKCVANRNFAGRMEMF